MPFEDQRSRDRRDATRVRVNAVVVVVIATMAIASGAWEVGLAFLAAIGVVVGLSELYWRRRARARAQ